MSGSFDFDYTFPDMFGDMASGALGILTGAFLLGLLVGLALAAVSYVLTAMSTYRIAKRRGIHKAWMAWVPILNYWQLGSISDHYQYVVNHKVTNRRRILLVLGIVNCAMSIVYSILQVSTVLAFNADAGMSNEVSMVAVSMLVYMLYFAVTITASVFSYIACYDLYRSCKPNNAVLFLVLGIFFSVAQPFFLIACSNSDEGMPPKRAPQPPVQIPYAPETPVEAPAEPAPAQAPAEEAPVAEEIPVVEAEIVEDSE